MTDKEVVESFDNAWRALARQYQKYPDNDIRCGLNLLREIIGNVKAEVEENHKEGQITIDEWIIMLQEGIK